MYPFSWNELNFANITLHDDKLPWAKSAKHVVGNILVRDDLFMKDIRRKRAAFIRNVHNILQEFYFAIPLVKMTLISKYATSFYGSSLWSFFDGICDKLFTAWNNAVRNIFDIPRGSHRYFIGPLSDHLVMLCSRFLKFHEMLKNSPKSCMIYLS